MNNAMIIGNLTRDPIVRTVMSKELPTKVANFTVAVNNDRSKDGKATYFRVTVWRGLAEIAEKYLKKGRKVFVQGSVDIHAYVGSNGQAYHDLVLYADKMEFLDSKIPGTETEAAPTEEQADAEAYAEEEQDSGLPF